MDDTTLIRSAEDALGGALSKDGGFFVLRDESGGVMAIRGDDVFYSVGYFTEAKAQEVCDTESEEFPGITVARTTYEDRCIEVIRRNADPSVENRPTVAVFFPEANALVRLVSGPVLATDTHERSAPTN